MTHTFDSGGFFTFLVALAHGVAPPCSNGPDVAFCGLLKIVFSMGRYVSSSVSMITFTLPENLLKLVLVLIYRFLYPQNYSVFYQ